MKPRIETAVEEIRTEATAAVRSASALKYEGRLTSLARSFDDPEAAKTWAGARKAEVIANLRPLLKQLEEKCLENGIILHHAKDAAEARAVIQRLCDQAGGTRRIVKGKSMATEEIHLNHALEEAGFEVVETDLGEFVIQIDGDTPSHIVTPIVHRSRSEVAASFRREGIGGDSDSPDALTQEAREYLREKFKTASVGISGVNFAIAETGRLVITENEGNNRLCTTAPRVHIAVMGIEKILQTEADLPIFLKLLAGSATGQQVTVYTHFITGPKLPSESDGPEEVHLVFLDNGRSEALAGPYRDILRCIRCGACLNACPIYRSATGHAYEQVYPGPLGAVLGHALGERGTDLAKASTLCGSCEDVCPVRIPFVELLLRMRAENGGSVATQGFGAVASDARKWRASLKLLPLAPGVPGWNDSHATPSREGREFRSWWAGRGASQPEQRGRFESPRATQAPTKQPAQATGWDRFEEKATALGIRFLTASSREEALQSLGYEGWSPNDPWTDAIGVAEGVCAVAETGSILASAGSRLSSLCPPTSILFVSRVVETLQEALENIPERNAVLITGASRTADIEGVIVKGVHGPTEVIVVRLTECPSEA